MKLLAPAHILVGLTAASAHAAEATAPTDLPTQQVPMQGLAAQVETLKAQIASATTRLFKIKECHADNKFFRKLPDGTEGCISPISPTNP